MKAEGNVKGYSELGWCISSDPNPELLILPGALYGDMRVQISQANGESICMILCMSECTVL